MKERLKQNSNGWYAVGGSFGVLALFMVIFINGIEGIQQNGILPLGFALIAALISIATLFCGSRKQRDGLFSALLIIHALMFVTGIITVLLIGPGKSDSIRPGDDDDDMSIQQMSQLIFLCLGLIASFVMDSVYEGVGNYRQKH